MNKDRILVVEDDFDIANMLRIYFQSQGYDITIAAFGKEALDLCQQQLPDVIVLNVMLPDIDGYEVCRRLQGNLYTRQAPIIFLTGLRERSDKITGLELGADHYLTKPCDVQELRLCVQNSIRRARMTNLSNPITGLPNGKQIEEQLQSLMSRDDWALLYIGVNHIDPFRDKEGFMAGDQVLRDLAHVLSEAVNEFGTPNDFVGHRGGDDFVVVSTRERGAILRKRIIARFDEIANSYYHFFDQENGCIALDGQQYPCMTLAVGLVSSAHGPFCDSLEITQVAAESRRAMRREKSTHELQRLIARVNGVRELLDTHQGEDEIAQFLMELAPSAQSVRYPNNTVSPRL